MTPSSQRLEPPAKAGRFREAYMQAGLRIFVLTAASLGSAETIGILLTAESHIRRVLDDDDGPFMYRVGKNGRVARLQ